MRYIYRTTAALVLVLFVFTTAVCSSEKQINGPRAVPANVGNQEKSRDHKTPKQSKKSPTEDREKKRMGILILLLLGAAEHPMSI